MKRYPIVAALWVTLATSASAGPFGLSQGQHLDQSADLKNTQGYDYFLKTVPSPHPKLPNYGVVMAPKSGICAISASAIHGNLLLTEKFVMGEFDELSRQLEGVYGDYEMFTGREVKKVDPSLENARVEIGAAWNDVNDEIESIRLYVSDFAQLGSFITLRYRFRNWSACVDELKVKTEAERRAQADAL